jgi:hypothetical protein
MAKEVKEELLEKTKDQFRELQLTVEFLQTDLLKNASGVGAAGSRSRKLLRELKKKCQEMIAFSNEVSKAYRPEKKD